MRIILSAIAIISFNSIAIAQQLLPLEDGAYLTNTQWCPLYFNNELDFVDFVVEKDGRGYSYPEQGCVVHSVKQIRDNRYQVEADCTEAGETFQSTTIMDIYSDHSIRIDGGEVHNQCQYAPYMDKLTKQDLTELRELMLGLKKFSRQVPLAIPTISPVKVQAEKRPDGFIETWHEHNENCRGGSGDDPSTDISCKKRDDLTQKLNKIGWCFGRENEAGAQYKWHACEAGSIR